MMTVLVANRGEIARRVIRTARRMGLRPVAVYSDADAALPFVTEADAAIRIGAAPAGESYLDPSRVIAAAVESGAGLVHPGYGFLSERGDFAAAVAAAGLRFVGPSPAVLRQVGDKAQAKAIAEAAGVPVLPGYRGADQRDEAFLAAAKEIGYPVMLKPAAGGGGIGMQLVTAEPAMGAALARARRTAQGAFGDERLILERAVTAPRHVEVQLLGDTHGALMTVGERDCSAQRRHQKVLEETPAPSIAGPLRTKLAAAALAIAERVGYTNAGTCEFIVDEHDDFFFLEVNARLQVEHPVTEAAYGVDLVEQQLRIAQGERLDLHLGAPRTAIEVRVYAEDPAAGFLPSTGRLVHVRWPEGVRVDAGYEEGSAVTRHYDPLLAKLIAVASDRGMALGQLARALDETELLGVRTNLPFLRALIAHPDVRAGRITTELIGRDLTTLAASAGAAPPAAYALAAAARLGAAAPVRTDPWSALGSWRAGQEASGLVILRESDDERAIRVTGTGPWTADGHDARRRDEPHRWELDGLPATAALDGSLCWVGVAGATYALETAPRERSVEALAGTEIAAPMPGLVLTVHAEADARVRRGDLICVIEAMKMELQITAPADGLVKRVLCAPGDQVRRGQRLAEFEAA
ncbi:MAG TPA: biotin carboxylase N-terminal domain-containing protein [Candidatus Saccharimonadales bacterium]|nr:biotin carboxylase N-terminal domain-containing protein [Candidatus Saccharimonadales bacterium]